MNQVDQNTNTFTWAHWAMIDGRLEHKMMISFSDIPVSELQKIRNAVLLELDFRMGLPSQPSQGIGFHPDAKMELPR